MPSFIDMTGQRYGRLVAVHLTECNGPKVWLFQCDCGNQKLAKGAFVRFGSIRSCGCLRKDTTAQMRSRDLVGHRSGRLVVLEKLESRDKHRSVQWRCLCDCGKEKTVTTLALGKKNPTRSCGCIRREQMRELGLANGQSNPVSRTPAYLAERKKEYRARPEYALASRLSRLMAFALKQVGGVKTSPTLQMLGYSAADLRAHMERQFVEGMSWSNRGEWEIDHITPISSAKTVEDVIRLNCLSNIRPMWSVENNRKNCRRTHLL